MKIGDRSIGPLDPCFIVAEIGLNHQGDVEIGEKLIRKAVACGVDAVKLQKRSPKHGLTAAALAAPYEHRNSFGRTYGEHRAKLELGGPEWGHLRKIAKDLKVKFFASAFDVPSLIWLVESVGIDAIKIPSCDLNHQHLLGVARECGLPIILSTGMATEHEIDRAVDTLAARRATRDLALLHCVSGYPVDNQDTNLRRITWLQNYGVPVGFSGHEKGLVISVAAVALGACIVERHFTLDRTMPGPDHAASLEPEGLRRLVRDIRKVEAALGSRLLEQPLPCEMASKKKLRKSAVAARWLPAGQILGTGDIAWKAPEVDGAAPPDLDIRGRALLMRVDRDEPIMLSNLSGPAYF